MTLWFCLTQWELLPELNSRRHALASLSIFWYCHSMSRAQGKTADSVRTLVREKLQTSVNQNRKKRLISMFANLSQRAGRAAIEG
jgi:hypothetical protein